jgi:hypothetical protein
MMVRHINPGTLLVMDTILNVHPMVVKLNLLEIADMHHIEMLVKHLRDLHDSSLNHLKTCVNQIIVRYLLIFLISNFIIISFLRKSITYFDYKINYELYDYAFLILIAIGSFFHLTCFFMLNKLLVKRHELIINYLIHIIRQSSMMTEQESILNNAVDNSLILNQSTQITSRNVVEIGMSYLRVQIRKVFESYQNWVNIGNVELMAFIYIIIFDWVLLHYFDSSNGDIIKVLTAFINFMFYHFDRGVLDKVKSGRLLHECEMKIVSRRHEKLSVVYEESELITTIDQMINRLSLN